MIFKRSGAPARLYMGPQTLGLRPCFGMGDRLGLATPGHIAAAREAAFAPLFAQQSVREMQRTGRSPEEVLGSAAQAVAAENWSQPWGADADHLHTPEDVAATARAGFTLFTIDPSAHMSAFSEPTRFASGETARSAFGGTAGAASGEPTRFASGETARSTFGEPTEALAACGEPEQALDLYLGKRFDLGPGLAWEFPDRETIAGIAAKYSYALAHIRRMHGLIREACSGRDYEVEVSIDETASPTTPLEHLFIGLELKRMDLPIMGLAPHFAGSFEKGVDYRGSLEAFTACFREHVAIARFCGPYRISVHSGSDKFSIYPIIGRLAGDLLHVKTAGTSYLEALRVICLTDPKLFGEIARYSRERYERDRATYHVSARLGDIPENLPAADLEETWLNGDAGRQVLHVGYGSVLTEGKRPGGQGFRQAILENLMRNDSLHREVLVRHLGRHLKMLRAG